MKNYMKYLLGLMIPMVIATSASAADFKKYNELVDNKLAKYKLIETEGDLNYLYPNKERKCIIYGVTDYSTRHVQVKITHNEKRDTHTEDHEVGHVFDTWPYLSPMMTGDIGHFYSGCEEFQKIFEKEHNSIETYSTEMDSSTNSSEYFAECFAWYIEEPDKLKESSPLTYAFIDKAYNWKDPVK